MLPDSTTFDELVDLFGISRRTCNVCEREGLDTLGKLRIISNTSKGFRGLRGCGITTRIELQILLEKSNLRSPKLIFHDVFEQLDPRLPGGPSFSHPPSRSKDISLDQIATFYKLSVRAINVCENAGFKMLSDIIDFKYRHGGFMKLRNCGAKTVRELESLLEQAEAHDIDQHQPIFRSDMEINNSIVSRFFDILFSCLSMRAQQKLESLIGLPTATSAINFFRDHGWKWALNNGITGKTFVEIDELRRQFFEAIKRSANSISSAPNELRPDVMGFWYLRHNIAQEQRYSLFDSQGKMNLFHFLQKRIEQNSVNSKTLVWQAFLEPSEEPKSLADIALSTGLSKERVRQLLQHFDREFRATVACIKDLPEVALYYPEFYDFGPMLMIGKDLVDKVKSADGIACSPVFILFVAQALHGNRYKRVLWTDLFGRTNDSKALDHISPLLVEAHLKPPLENVARKLNECISQRRTVSTQVNLWNYLSDLNNDQANPVIDIMQKMIALIFPHMEIMNGLITIMPNKKMKPTEMLQIVLESINEPSHISQIVDQWKNIFPGDLISESSIRSIVVRDSNRYFSIGRTSTYGLRAWIGTREEVMGGTLREIVEKYLAKKPSLVHISQVLSHVKKYRATSEKSLLQNIKLDQEGRFVSYNMGFIGLSLRDYGTSARELDLVRSLDFSSDRLQSYVKEKALKEILVKDLAMMNSVSQGTIQMIIDAMIATGRLTIDTAGVITAVHSVQKE